MFNEMVKSKKIITTTLVIRMREDGIIETKSNPDFEGIVLEQHARENMMAIEGISNGRWYPIMSYLPEHRVSDEAQNIYTKHPRIGLASALISKSMIQSLLGNILITLRGLGQKLPTKIFSKPKDAVVWLKDQREKLENSAHKNAS